MVRLNGWKSVVAGLLFLAVASSVWVQAKGPDPIGHAVAVTVAELPAEGAKTYRLIFKGGPFAYQKDGVVFGNRERLLPSQKRGYYREYTVATPGSSDRGARRIVCGGQPQTPDACYYTADHYESFRLIVP
jgi:ribonuclease T1